MQDHKLVQILRTFSKAEFLEFEKFVSSAFHNEGRNYIPFVKELKKYYPEFESRNFNKETLFRKLYTNKKVSSSLMDTTISRVLKMAETYLGYKAYIRKEANAKYDFMQELLARGLYNIAEKELKEYSALVNTSEGISDELIKGRMDFEILNVQLSFRNDKMQAASGPAIKQTDYHIRFTLMRLAHFLHNIKVNNLMFNVDYDETFVKKFTNAVNFRYIYDVLKKTGEKNEFDEITLIYVIWILGVIDTKNEDHFFEMKSLVLKNLHRFHHHEKYNLFQALEAIAWLMQQEVNREKYETELYEMYKKRLEHRILSPDNTHMRINLFRAILVVLIYKPDWDFIDNFISTCIPLLQKEHRENMYNYAMAYTYYHKKDYEKALEYNSKINFELFALRYDNRLLQFQIYYELNYFDEAYSLIDTHRHFISNNKTVSGYYKEMHTNFLNFYSELLKSRYGEKVLNSDVFAEKLSLVNNVLSRVWLLKKAEELSENCK